MIYAKGAALLHGIATAHGFNDGNKRTAWLCTALLYEQSGYILHTGAQDRVDDLVVDVVTGVIPQADLQSWLKDRTQRPPR